MMSTTVDRSLKAIFKLITFDPYQQLIATILFICLLWQLKFKMENKSDAPHNYYYLLLQWTVML